jgi:hypothetical protein
VVNLYSRILNFRVNRLCSGLLPQPWVCSGLASFSSGSTSSKRAVSEVEDVDISLSWPHHGLASLKFNFLSYEIGINNSSYLIRLLRELIKVHENVQPDA